MFTRADADPSAPDALPPENEKSYPIAALLSAVVQKADIEALFQKHDTDSFFHIFMVQYLMIIIHIAVQIGYYDNQCPIATAIRISK